jgi:hypothetical protein
MGFLMLYCLLVEDNMKPIVALILTVMLVGSGCAQRGASYALHSSTRLQPAARHISLTQRDAEDWRRYIANLPLGTTLQIDLADGSRLTGIILSVEQDAVVVQPKTRLPSPTRRIPFDTIVALAPESSKGLNAGNALAIGAVAGVASFITLFLIVWSLGD